MAMRSRRIIDINLLNNRTDQIIQVDIHTGHRSSTKRTVRDITHVRGMTFGTVSIEYTDYRVRQIGKTREWYFCDEQGNRVKRQFQKFNDDWDKAAPRHLERFRRRNETSSEGGSESGGDR